VRTFQASMRRAPLNPAFAKANARGTDGLQQKGGSLDQRLSAGRASGVVDLSGLHISIVPAAVFAIIDAPAASSSKAFDGSFDAPADRWWENESVHVAGGVARLNLGRNEIGEIPADLARLEGLRTLECAHNAIAALPTSALARLTSLQLLDASHNQLSTFGVSGLTELRALSSVNLSHNRLVRLGAEVGCLSSLHALDISHNALRELPEELCGCGALQTLQVNDNRLAALPRELGRLRSLAELECGHNQLTTLPESIGGCGALARADCRHNRIGVLPGSLVACAALAELYLGANALTASAVPPLAGADGQGLPQLAVLDLSGECRIGRGIRPPAPACCSWVAVVAATNMRRCCCCCLTSVRACVPACLRAPPQTTSCALPAAPRACVGSRAWICATTSSPRSSRSSACCRR
jgi:hypothetical protein